MRRRKDGTVWIKTARVLECFSFAQRKPPSHFVFCFSKNNFINKHNPKEILIRWDKDKNLSCEILFRGEREEKIWRMSSKRKKQLDETDVPEDIQREDKFAVIYFQQKKEEIL